MKNKSTLLRYPFMLAAGIAATSYTATAQKKQKMGENPNSITTGKNLDIEAKDGTHFVIDSASTSVGIGTTATDASAILKLGGTTKGFLPPVLTTAQRTALVSPAAGLVIYNSTTSSLEVNTGTSGTPAWTATSGTSWGLQGNAGTDAANDFIGTTDDVHLIFKMNNTHSGLIDGDNESTAFGYNTLPDNGSYGNTALGANTLSLVSGGYLNVAVGDAALSIATSGGGNVGIGSSALTALTDGGNNTAVGSSALSATTGSNNTALGGNTALLLSSGSNNIAIGASQNLASNTADYQLNIGGAIFGTGLNGSAAAPAGNIGIGNANPTARLHAFSTGTTPALKLSVPFGGAATDSLLTWNPADSSVRKVTAGSIGWGLSGNAGTDTALNFIGTTDAQPLIFKTNGVKSGVIDGVNANTAIGSNALLNNAYSPSIGGYSNTAFGQNALKGNTSGAENTGMGFGALQFNTTGSSNTAIGNNTLFDISTGENNVGLGSGAGAATTTGSNNIAIGSFQALPVGVAGSNQLNIGGAIFGTGMTGTVGAPAGNIGINNTAPSAKLDVSNNGSTTVAALKLRTPFSGSTTDSILTWNSADASVRKVTAGSMGWGLSGNAGTTPGTHFIGTTDVGQLMFKVAGVQSGYIDDGNISATTGLGYSAVAKTTGYGNTGIGHFALPNNVGGALNTALGSSALNANISGNNNTGIGNAALVNALGSDNTAIGRNSGSAIITGSNNLVIGSAQNVLSSSANGQMNIGGGIFGTGMTGTVAAPAGNIGISNTVPTAKLDVSNNGSTTVAALKVRTPFSGAATDSLLTWNPADSSVRKISSAALSSGWSLSGNTATAANYIGTNNNVPLLFKQNSKIAGGITDGDGTANTSFGSLSPDFSNPSVTGTSNSFFGGYAGNALTSGINNTGIGQGALISITSGGSNIAVGETALGSIETGTGNTALGTEAMITAIGSASNNTVVGFLALPGGFGMSGNNNLVLGALAGSEVTGLSNNNIIVGAGQEVGTGTAYTTSNKMNIAGAIFGTGISGTYAAPAGNIGISNTAPTAKLDVSNNGSTTVAALKVRTPFHGSISDSLLTWSPSDSSVRKIAIDSIVAKANIRTKTMAFTAEYGGGVVTTNGLAGASSVGQMSGVNDTTSGAWRNAYNWVSSQTTVQKMNVILRVQVPADFDKWATGASFSLDYQTGGASGLVDYKIMKASGTAVGTTVTGLTNTSWTTATQDLSASSVLAAGDYFVVVFTMSSSNSIAAKIADVSFKYISK